MNAHICTARCQDGTKTAERRHRGNDCRSGVTGMLHFELGIIVLIWNRATATAMLSLSRVKNVYLFDEKYVFCHRKNNTFRELLTGRQPARTWRPVSNCSFTGDVVQKMKVFHVCELGSQLAPLKSFISLCPKRIRDHSSLATCLERFSAFYKGRVAKSEYAHLHSTAPGRHQDGTKTTLRKRLPAGGHGKVAFWDGNYSIKLKSCEC